MTRPTDLADPAAARSSAKAHVIRGAVCALIIWLAALGAALSDLLSPTDPIALLVLALSWASAAVVVVLALGGWGAARLTRSRSLARVRQSAPHALAWSAAFAIAVVVLLPMASVTRHLALRALTWRAQPLVTAIHAYQHEHGTPPASLQDLVPAYLAAVPGTGLRHTPRYQYSMNRANSTRTMHWYDLGSRQGAEGDGPAVFDAGDPGHAILVLYTDHADRVVTVLLDRLPAVLDERAFDAADWAAGADRIAMARDAGPSLGLVGLALDEVAMVLGRPDGSELFAMPEWELAVDCTSPLKFDQFVYWPSETYPRSLYGGATRRIGSWAFVDE